MDHIILPSGRTLGLPFSQAVRAGDFLFLSGAIGNRPGTLTLVEGGLAAQARQTMKNIGEVLKACGLGFGDTVKFTVMLADMARWAEFNAVYLGYFDPDRLPARSAFGASGLALGGEVEVECVAYWPACVEGLPSSGLRPTFSHEREKGSPLSRLRERAGVKVSAALGPVGDDLDVDVAARRVAIRADLFVRLVDERLQFALRQARVGDVEHDRKAEAALLARADRDGAFDRRFRRVLLVLLGDVVELAAEAGGVTGGEKMLGRGRARLAGTAHLLRHRQVDVHHSVVGAGMAVAAAGRGRMSGVKRLDRIGHVHSSSTGASDYGRRRRLDHAFMRAPSAGTGSVSTRLAHDFRHRQRILVAERLETG